MIMIRVCTVSDCSCSTNRCYEVKYSDDKSELIFVDENHVLPLEIIEVERVKDALNFSLLFVHGQKVNARGINRLKEFVNAR